MSPSLSATLVAKKSRHDVLRDMENVYVYNVSELLPFPCGASSLDYLAGALHPAFLG